MRSSTSSSDERLPRGGWGRTWRVAGLLLVVVLGGLEVYWRLRGFPPRIYAADDAWILQMMRVRTGRATSAILGSSRVQAALHPESYQAVMGGNVPANLAMPGASPLPLLEYIADSTQFTGVVVTELLPLFAFDGTQHGARQVEDLLRRFHGERVSPASLSEDWLRVHALRYLVFRSPQLLPVRLYTLHSQGREPQYPEQTLTADRFGPVDNRLVLHKNAWDAKRGYYQFQYPDVERGGRVPEAGEWAVIQARYDSAAARIARRGGRVVFVYMSACGRRLEIEEGRYPRQQFWDPFARQSPVPAFTTLDNPAFQRFDCWDGSHIDIRDTPAYGLLLAENIRDALGAPR